MAAEVKSESIEIKGQKVTLVSVRGGENAIGTFTMGASRREGSLGAITRLLYVGNEPILNITCPNGASKESDKLISVCPGFHGYDRSIYDLLSSAFTRLNQGDAPVAGLRDVFTMLQDGVYAIYVSDYYPTDGNGVFFWGGYNTNHEVRGSAEHNGTIGDKNEFKPCFLMPTQSLDYYTSRGLSIAENEVNSRRIQGIAYHVSGFHSALLKGHHGAVVCTRNDVPFKCAVIEKISEPYTEKIQPIKQPPTKSEAEAAENTENAQDNENPEPKQPEAAVRATVPITEHEGITGFRSPSFKIPIELFPKDMLNVILNSLSEYKPPHFGIISAKFENAVRKKVLSNNVLQLEVLEKAEQMPDVSMVESAYAIPSISDEELNCLLAGDVEYNGRIIISPNFYASIVTACNYLQFTDMKRFIDFSIAIMDNPELSATHEYAAKRASSQEKNVKLYNFFKTAVSSKETKYEKILKTANSFVARYEKTQRR